MTCSQATQKMSLQILGFLNPQQSQALAEHMQHCVACRRVFEKRARAYADLKNLENGTPPPYLAERIVAQARQKLQQPMPGSGRWLGLALGAGAVVMAVVVAPCFHGTQSNLTQQEVLAAYVEDFENLGFSTSTGNSNETFNYETYGIPTAVSQYLL